MNVVAHLFLWSGIIMAVTLGDPRPSVSNKWDENAVSLVILGALFALMDTASTIYGWLP